MGFRQRWGQIVLACVMVGLIMISGLGPGFAALQPGKLLTQARAITDNETLQPRVPDWLQITFASLPTIEGDGGFDGSSLVGQLGYDISRAWEDGMSPDQMLQLGDIRELGPEWFSLQGIERIVQSPLGGVSLANFPLIGEQTLQSLNQAVPGLSERLISETPPIQALLDAQGMGDLANRALANVLDQWPELADLRLDQIDLSSFSVLSIPGLMETPLAQLENWQGSLISEIPGLNQVPLGRFPNPLRTAGGISMRIDMVYGPAEVSREHTISGSYEQGFAVPCAQPNQDCAYIELDDLENKGRAARGQTEGRQWISGKYQDVKGGHGVLGSLNGGREPTGRHPFGSAFKVVVWEPDETADTVSTALFFRVCGKFVGCSPYFIGPLPFFSYQRDDMIFVGLLDGGVGSTGPPSRPTGAQPGGGFPSFSGFPDLGGLSVSGVDDPCFTLNPKGVDLETLASAIASLQSPHSDYRTVGTYTCADGGGRCGRSLGRYQLMSDQPEAVQQIQRAAGGQAFLDRVNRGHRPSEAEMRQYFPPEAQDLAFQNVLAHLGQQAAGQIDPTTGRPFQGRRLIERATQMYFGGADSIIDGDSADVYLVGGLELSGL